MAFIFTDGFDSCAVTADLSKKWIIGGAFAFGTTAGKFGGGGCTSAANVNNQLTSNSLFGNVTTGIYHFGFYAKWPTAVSNAAFAQFINLAGSSVAQLRWVTSATGIVGIFNSGGSSVNSANLFNDNQWHWFEFQLNFANSSQTQKLYVDNALVISGAMNFGSGNAFDKFGFVANGAFNGLDDVVIYDDNGNFPTSANYPIGPQIITTLRPNADSAVQFARSAGSTNFSLVNETVADSDTSYVEDATSGDQDLYDFDDLGYNPVSISGVMLNGYVKSAGPAVTNYEFIGKSGITQRNGTSTQVPINYTNKQMEFGVDPATSSLWTPTNLNAAKFGIKVP